MTKENGSVLFYHFKKGKIKSPGTSGEVIYLIVLDGRRAGVVVILSLQVGVEY